MIKRNWIRNLLLGLVVSIALGAPVDALLLDDFSDGNDDGWTDAAGPASVPATFDASSGRYELASTGIVTEAFRNIEVLYDDSVSNPLFSDGVLSANIIFDTPQTSATLGLRTGSDPISGYYVGFNNALDGVYLSAIGPSRSACNTEYDYCSDSLGNFSFAIEEATPYNVRLSAIGSELGVSIWASGDAEPMAPQITASDVVLTQGSLRMGLYAYETLATGPATLPMSASFDDVEFSPVPEPTTGLMLGVGLAGLGVSRKREAAGRP